ncbi:MULTISPECIES: SsgA family sporulation/cell division regulator [Cellulomonas]|uniref:Sporulation and cell division protein SsgA n=1 Tax=Cellulomonas gilvus (strain ATCC 13127 / NRRL B-14078) TaxID=593907 RepID=F8A4X6_CELGA|nr:MULTISPECIES: SsgA family sporulation/cell division regulator [Cellulomonas]AEI12079.1 sporulation and cell division protein SsgA [Cellulomonas gilvus ATCC 13127]MCR6690151.1 SsgA family sporulation/cell division regulator [Cellulomonas sp.]
MTHSSYDVVEVVAMQLIGSDASVIPVSAELSFRTTDPYTVRAVFTGPHTMSTWLIGRELLSMGMHAAADAPAGSGDVQVWRDEDPDYALVSLSGVEGSALLAAPSEPILRFLATTESLVPLGSESDRMESEISAFIAALLTA